MININTQILNFYGDSSTPNIFFDSINNYFEISGRSIPMYPAEFFAPIISWINEYAKQPLPKTELHIKLDFYNSISTLWMLETIKAFGGIKKNGGNFNVVWHYEEDDIDSLADGKMFAKVLNVDFVFKKYIPKLNQANG